MHADEAAFLTLKSIFIPNGDIHLFDMGESISIVDLIEKLQSLLGGSSNLVFTGLRHGEKINEDLFGGLEESIVTLPGLIESSSHKTNLSINKSLIAEIIARNDGAYYRYIGT